MLRVDAALPFRLGKKKVVFVIDEGQFITEDNYFSPWAINIFFDEATIWFYDLSKMRR